MRFDVTCPHCHKRFEGTLLSGRSAELNRAYGPRETVEEIKQELQDLERR